ncbi:polyketide cyclase/dehydrase/lipid transport protein [Maribacter spongiicola]|uniref:Polyketide cyclase/dehydrase/lipid transport protein n=1 Tax=Maribacter spongiicola TaxID=1206753 RepID=A0A4R7K2C4_9FLAO|nr:SRPBCC family protein [Maribacter spongiicola]TDT45032.1 polyketide cyclase/dehydrase/lipid transport protein [Maribacter spongiicola]
MDKYKIIFLSIVIVCATSFVNGQTFNKVKVTNDIEMTRNMDEVWTAISNLANLDKLVPEIISKTAMVGNGKGSVITLTLKSNGLEVVEKVTKLDNEKHIIVYEMLETPMPISGYKATIKIIPFKTNSYKVSFDAVFKVQDKNRETMETTISNFQKTLLSNIKKQYNYEK